GLALRLQALARRVPYLGRATSPVLLTPPADEEDPGVERYSHTTGGPLRLRVPYPGYLAALRSAYDHEQPAWIVEQTVAYRRGDPPPDPEEEPVQHGAYTDMVVVGFPTGESLDGRHTLAVTGAFKAAILERLGKPR